MFHDSNIAKIKNIAKTIFDADPFYGLLPQTEKDTQGRPPSCRILHCTERCIHHYKAISKQSFSDPYSSK